MADTDAISAGLGRAQSLHRAGQLAQAEMIYRQVLQADPVHPEALHLLGMLMRQSGRATEAATHYRRALELRPLQANWWRALASILVRLNRLEEAAEAHVALLKLTPNDADVHHSYAVVLDRLDRIEEALQEFRMALAIRPQFPAALVNLARAKARQGDNAGAIEAARKALEIDPAMPEAYLNLADFLAAEGRMNEAIDLLQRGAGIQTQSPETFNNLGTHLLQAGRACEAVAALRKASQLLPGDANIYGNLASALVETAAMEEAEEAYHAVTRCSARSPVVESNYVYHLNDMSHHSPQEVFEAHRQWAAVHASARSASIVEHHNNPDPSRKLRIGYVSADFRTHSVAFFIEPILAHHDHGQFEVVCFADELKSDDVTARLQRYADRWHRITGWNHDRVAQLVRQEQIDILIDLAGHTGPNRLLVFASKPAPVQITYLGYPTTTGLSTMDYRITDAVADPPGATERFHTENLLRLPDCFLCYRMPASAPEVAPSPPVMKNGRIAFGSFNNIVKTSPRVIGMWARILRQVPNSRLTLKARGLDDPQTRKAILDRLEKFGVPADRVDPMPRHATLAEHLSSYGQIDIALDTYPYHGTTTTCEATIMGVPVISLAGPTHVSRVGTTLLTSIGHPELIAQSEEEYIAKAAALAGDRERLFNLRKYLRSDLLQSPLADETGFVRKLESAYRQAWSKWCATRH